MLFVLLACTANNATTDSATPDSAAPDSAAPDSATPDTAPPDTAPPEESGTGLLVLIGEATIGKSYSGTEVISFHTTSGEGVSLCVVSTPVESVAARTDCADCIWAFDIVFGTPEVTVDVACEAAGYDSDAIAALEGTERAYGFADEHLGHAEALLVFQDDIWSAVSFADWDEQTRVLSYEWEQGYLSY